MHFDTPSSEFEALSSRAVGVPHRGVAAGLEEDSRAVRLPGLAGEVQRGGEVAPVDHLRGLG